MVSFRVSNLARVYTVHKDLVCRTSKHFKSQLQRNRRAIPSTCSTCLEDLNPIVKDITFCSKCGQNFHEECINQWMRYNATCPLCRSAWTSDPQVSHASIDHELDNHAVQTYITWLYTGDLIVDNLSALNSHASLALLKCWEVAVALDDADFKKAVIRTFFTKTNTMLSSACITFAFEERKGSDELRDFITEVCLSRKNEGWFVDQSARWPAAFVSAMADRCLRIAKLGLRWRSIEEISASYVR